MTKRPLTGREESRIKAMNKQLYPARLRVLPSGAFQFDYRRDSKHIRKVVGQDLEDAYERALVMRREADKLPIITNRQFTLQQWYEAWAKKRFLELSPTTVEGYRHQWNAIPEYLKVRRIEKLTRDEIQTSLSDIDKPSMRGHAGALIATVLNAAVKAGQLSRSPWSFKDKREKKNLPILSPSELKDLIQLASPTAQVGLALAAFCGLRRAEIMGLKAEDIDFEKRLLYVHQNRVRIYGENGSVTIKDTKTGHHRTLPIPDIAIPFIEPAVKGRDGEEFLYLVFRNDLHTRLKTACRKTGIREMTLHDLRHMCGSNCMMQGGVAYAQAILGHTDITTTVDTYGHLTAPYLTRQMGLMSLDSEVMQETKDLAVELGGHDDEKVRRVAGLLLRLCQYLSI